MNNKIDIIVADPSGNTTIMVLTPVERKDYIEVAGRLLADRRINGGTGSHSYDLPDAGPMDQTAVTMKWRCADSSSAAMRPGLSHTTSL